MERRANPITEVSSRLREAGSDSGQLGIAPGSLLALIAACPAATEIDPSWGAFRVWRLRRVVRSLHEVGKWLRMRF